MQYASKLWAKMCILAICVPLPGQAHEFHIICLATTISLEAVEV
jgi:hypothetical protein